MDLLTAIELLILSAVLAAAGGAVTGLKIGGEFLGKELAAMMGAFFGPSSVLPAVVLGIIVLAWLK
ncbi:hypothetical protein TPL01_20300 [Sulfuriferula plumbiphila]|uniref:Uncharacterized protein n=1 Tax=Sulfuriferula plumbiphila TaxID=171865 RepID=A0A512L8U9_9PROT|nr:hypothetical protein [Sulfuriferula plumbiphila]BBP04278.1 hypothetical protein SFPGR_17000 [Sulfuriferula plumbiphila]GEP30892.1 hypothetical protein TPL01_20300 [Sulfuriferula plumbiphila]